MAAVEDTQAETGYTVETVDNPFEFDISEVSIRRHRGVDVSLIGGLVVLYLCSRTCRTES